MKYPLNKYYNIEQLLKPDEKVIIKHNLFYFTNERIIFSRFFHKYYESLNYGDIKHVNKRRPKIFYIQFYAGIAMIVISIVSLLFFNNIFQFIFYVLMGSVFVLNYKVNNTNSIEITYNNKKVAFFAGNEYSTIIEFINKMMAK